MLALLHSSFAQFVLVMVLAILPAYILGRFLPSNARLEGPFKGFTVSFGGSFALYAFILVLGGGFIAAVHKMAPDYVPMEISGRLVFDEKNGMDTPPHQLQVGLHPSNLRVSEIDGGFIVTVVSSARKTPGQGIDRLPEGLIFNYPGFVTSDVQLKQDMIGLGGRVELEPVVLRSVTSARTEAEIASR